MPSRRTIKKPTRWTAEEWRHIEEAARARGVPPLRYVREAALAAKLPPRVRRRGAHELIRQLTRLLNNLHQLERVAEEEGVHHVAAAIQATIRITDDAVRAAAGRPGSAHPLIIAVREAGRSRGRSLPQRAHAPRAHHRGVAGRRGVDERLGPHPRGRAGRPTVIGRAHALGRSFKKLVSYLKTGKDGRQRQRDRVEWVEFRNLPTRNPDTAACMMAATAGESVSGTREPVYHFSVSCDPCDPVDSVCLQRVADRLIRDLDLDEYQVLIFAHKDRAHPHLHFVVNSTPLETRPLLALIRFAQEDHYQIGFVMVESLQVRIEVQSRELSLVETVI